MLGPNESAPKSNEKNQYSFEQQRMWYHWRALVLIYINQIKIESFGGENVAEPGFGQRCLGPYEAADIYIDTVPRPTVFIILVYIQLPSLLWSPSRCGIMLSARLSH